MVGHHIRHDDKIRVVLNKADAVDSQKLLRIYGAHHATSLVWWYTIYGFRPVDVDLRCGRCRSTVRIAVRAAPATRPRLCSAGALMWSLGKVIKTPECMRVYIGSFWDQPLRGSEWSRQLFEMEMRDLLTDLKNVPKNAAVRKVNELVKRVRLAKAHHPRGAPLHSLSHPRGAALHSLSHPHGVVQNV